MGDGLLTHHLASLKEKRNLMSTHYRYRRIYPCQPNYSPGVNEGSPGAEVLDSNDDMDEDNDISFEIPRIRVSGSSAKSLHRQD